jgi:hypothetical protein
MTPQHLAEIRERMKDAGLGKGVAASQIIDELKAHIGALLGYIDALTADNRAPEIFGAIQRGDVRAVADMLRAEGV